MSSVYSDGVSGGMRLLGWVGDVIRHHNVATLLPLINTSSQTLIETHLVLSSPAVVRGWLCQGRYQKMRERERAAIKIQAGE